MNSTIMSSRPVAQSSGASPTHAGARQSATFGAFWPLAVSFGKVFIRNRIQVFFSIVFPFFFLAMFSFIGLLLQADPEVATVNGDTSTFTIAGDSIATNEADSVQSAIDDLHAGQLLAVADIDAKQLYVAEGSQQQVLEAEAARQGYDVVVIPKAEILDPMRFGLPGVLTFAMLNVAFFGTTAPLLEMRRDGALNVLRRTPARPVDIILAPLPSRTLAFAGVLSVSVAFALAMGYIGLSAVPASIGAGLLGFVAATSWAYLLGARGTSADLANGVSGMLLPLLLMISGALLPLDIMPDIVRTIAGFIPVAHVASLMRSALTGAPPMWPVAVSIAVIVVSSIAAVAAAARMFRWS